MAAITQVWEHLHTGTVWLVELEHGQVRAAAGPLQAPHFQHPYARAALHTPPASLLGRDINVHQDEYALYRA